MTALWLASLATLVVAGIPLAYLGVLALLARLPKGPPPLAPPRYRFAIIVPAHDEELSIAATTRSLLALDYPPASRRVIVVAHNCRDRTADLARAAGAEVVVYDDLSRATKGDALMRGVARALADISVDAVVVVDADTVVSKNLLTAFCARLSRGAHVIQAEYAVRNVEASWRTRLSALALGMFHRTRNLARQRLGLSVGLRGNGMCFSRSLLAMQPPLATGLVEDVEYGVQLGLAGYRVAYTPEAFVRGEMATDGRAAASQRRRWEGGRRQLTTRFVPRLLVAAMRQRSATLLDLAMDLIVPPLTYLALGLAAGLAFEGTRIALQGRADALTVLWFLATACLVLYGARGVQYSGLPLTTALRTLSSAPAYVVWKLAVMAVRRRDDAWVRTRREAELSLASRVRQRAESPQSPRAP